MRRVDISHFRAPYKNVMLAGFGAAPAGVTSPDGTLVAQQNAAGVFVVTPQASAKIEAASQATHFGVSKVNPVGTATATAADLDVGVLDPLLMGTATGWLPASTWITQQLAAGRSILAGTSAGIVGLQAFWDATMLHSTVGLLLKAVTAGQEASAAAPQDGGTGALYAVLYFGKPAGSSVLPPGVAQVVAGTASATAVVVGLAVAGGLYFILKPQKSFTANRGHGMTSAERRKHMRRLKQFKSKW